MHTTRTALLTGVTGFIGSSLAARLLQDGANVIAISRRDPDGKKTRSAIRRAARTLGIALPVDALTTRLTTLSIALEEVSTELARHDLRAVDTVWHLAANLSYRASGLERSLEVNQRGTVDLYRAVLTQAPACRRFYYVSTAYCYGFPRPDEIIPEALHAYPRSPNAYQLSKWCAETGLRQAAGEIPVTVVRPSIVIGHSVSGEYHGDAFGLYMFFSAVHPLLDLPGFRELRLPRETNGSINLIPIDDLLENMIGLAACADRLAPFEVVHCTGEVVPASAVARAGATVTGLQVTFDHPRSAFDRLFAQRVEENRIFAAHRFHFEEKRLPELLGAAFRPTELTEEGLERLIRVYLARLSRERGHLSIPSLLRPLLPMVTRSRTQLGPAVALLLARGYRRRAAQAVLTE